MCWGRVDSHIECMPVLREAETILKHVTLRLAPMERRVQMAEDHAGQEYATMERQARIQARDMKTIFNFQFSIFNLKRDLPSTTFMDNGNTMKELKSGAGFTLVELLTVIGIIGILAGVLMANFVGVRQRARDATRKSNLSQIQSALELYRSDQGGYPGSLPGCNSPLRDSGNTITYIQRMPCDPLGGSYLYTGAYSLRACLENTNDVQRDASNTCGAGRQSYTVYNP